MVNVFNFGAQGDGVNDDWAALQHAIERHGEIFEFIAGLYIGTLTRIPTTNFLTHFLKVM